MARHTQILLGIGQIQEHRHIPIKNAKQIDHLCIFPAAAGRHTDIQLLCCRFHRVRPAVIQSGRIVIIDRDDALCQQLGSFILPYRQSAIDHDDCIFVQ